MAMTAALTPMLLAALDEFLALPVVKTSGVAKRIVRRGDQWCVVSEDDSRSFGCYDAKSDAHRRLAQVEQFAGKALDPAVAKAAPVEPEWRALHRAANAVAPKVRAAFLQAVAETVDGVDEVALARALRAKDYRAAFRAIPWDEVGAGTLEDLMPPAMRDAAERAATASTGVLERAGFALDFDYTNPRMVDAANTATAELVTGVGDETKAAIRSIMGRSFSEGIPPRDAGRLIRPLIGLTERDANAVTNLWARMTDDGLPEGRVDRSVEQYAERLLNRRAECLTGETRVSGAVVRAVYRRWYEGPVVIIRTAIGRQVTATPNHPMLTRRGWVSAGLLQETDDLICDARKQDPRSFGNEDIQTRPASLREIFDTLAPVGTLDRAPVFQEDFHGDGFEGEVDILRPDRPLTLGRFTALDQPTIEAALAPAHAAGFRFCFTCAGLLTVDQPVRFSARAQMYSVTASQTTGDRPRRDIQASSNQPGRLPRSVPSLNLLDWQRKRIGTSSACQACRANDSRDYRLGDSNDGRDLPRRQPISIEFDRVTLLLWRSAWSGHVYNLSTPDGYYIADGVFTGNTIARTETIRAAQIGQDETWTQAAERGLIDPATATRVWLAAESPRTCDICEGLDGQEVGLDEPFQYGGEEYDGPPDPHPDCRCSLGLNP